MCALSIRFVGSWQEWQIEFWNYRTKLKHNMELLKLQTNKMEFDDFEISFKNSHESIFRHKYFPRKGGRFYQVICRKIIVIAHVFWLKVANARPE